MTRTPQETIAYARAHRTYEVGMCQQYVRIAYGIGGGAVDATAAWNAAKFKHPVKSGAQVPRGAPVYWTGGSKGHGHVAIATGNGNCWSTDAGGAGKVAKVNIDELTRMWSLDFQGWVEDINGVRVFDASAVGRPTTGDSVVRLKQVQPDPRAEVKQVQQALRKKMPKSTKDLAVDGFFGPATQAAYAEWQRRCGFTDADADGIPGKVSLQRLGFRVA